MTVDSSIRPLLLSVILFAVALSINTVYRATEMQEVLSEIPAGDAPKAIVTPASVDDTVCYCPRDVGDMIWPIND